MINTTHGSNAIPQKICHCMLRASLQVPNTSKKLKALSPLPTARAFICFSVSGTLDEALAVVFDILLEGQLHSRKETA